MDITEMIQRTDPRLFNPFRPGNVLPKLSAGLKLTDSSLIVQAASAFYPLAASIMQTVFDPAAFREETLRKVSTMVGFDDLISGASDILIATAPSDEQENAMNRSGFRFTYITLCPEPLVFLAHRSNPVDTLTSGQIIAMYSDGLTSWKEVGGRNLPVTTYQLEKNNGSHSAFEQIVPRPSTGPAHEIIRTMPEIVDAVAKEEGGICYAFWSYYTKMYATRLTKMLNIDNRGPMADDYPFCFPVYMIFRSDNQKPSVTQLARWLKTDEGREIIRRSNRCWRSI